MNRFPTRATGALLTLALFAACSGAEEIISGTALVATADEAPGANCELGGTAVSYGVDLNENGALDAAEVTSTSYLCATEEGGAPLVSTSPEPAGANCEFGGFAISSGVDTNGDGSLGGDEVTNTTYACAGEPEPVGAPLGAATTEPAGENCEFGGQRIDVGADLNEDGSLDSGEITSTLYACADATGTLASSATYLGEGDAACPGGYVERSYGIDTNADGALEPGEVGATFTACNLAPGLTGESVFFVDSCTDGGTFDLAPVDLDGSVADVAFEFLLSTGDIAISIDDAGLLTLGGGNYSAGAVLAVTVSDEFGTSSTSRVTLVFNGEGCEPLNAFHGVDPDSCREIPVNAAGDDRGNATVTRSWVYYNGDDALVRADLNLDDVETVVAERVDTLLQDNATGDLYSLWSSTFEFDSVLDSEGALEDDGGGFIDAWDQVVALDEDELTVLSTVTLTPPIETGDQPGFNYGTEAEPALMEAYDVFVAMRGNRLATAHKGYDSTNDLSVMVFRVYDTETGTLLHTWTLTSSNEAYYLLEWRTQEVSLQHFPMWIVDDVEYVLLPAADGWTRLNMRDGTFTVASATYAQNCDQQNVALDVSGLRAYNHNEYGCWGTTGDENLAVCDVLLVPNDGSIDDSGDGGE